MGFYQERPTALTILLAQRWTPLNYKRDFKGYDWPEVEYVAGSSGVPAHGIYHGAEGDVVVAMGDYVTLDPSSGDFAASSWYAFAGTYEEVANVPN